MFRFGLLKQRFGVSPDEMAFSRFRARRALARAGFADVGRRAVRLPAPRHPGGLGRARPRRIARARADSARARDRRLDADARATGLSRARLEEHRRLWAAKPVLARVYAPWFERLLAEAPRGARVVEVGAGPGTLRAFARERRPDLAWLATDLEPVPWNDVAADAGRLPVRSGIADAVLGLDVLHHLAGPRGLLRGGRPRPRPRWPAGPRRAVDQPAVVADLPLPSRGGLPARGRPVAPVPRGTRPASTVTRPCRGESYGTRERPTGGGSASARRASGV